MTRYAIQLTLGIKDVISRKITDDYSVHRVVYDLFPRIRTTGEGDHSGFLYSDLGGSAKGRRILILSDRTPEKLDLRDSSLEIKEIPATFLGARSYRYKVDVNPAVRGKTDGKIRPVKGREEIALWFANRSSRWGFTADSVEVASVRVLSFLKGGHPVTIERATLTGVLTVTDRALFTRSFTSGIGRAKSFGCGLLQIVPIH